MDLDLGRRLATLSQATYAPDPLRILPLTGQPKVDGFTTPSFQGLAVSDEEAVYLVFRGTKRGPTQGDDLKANLGGWVTNLDFQLKDMGGYRVHRGFAAETEAVLKDLKALALDHGAERKPLYLAGHSAGGALATLGARRLHEAGVPVRGAVVFSSPRVGDRRFAETYPVPLARIERRHDIVPHLPFPPSLAKTLGRLVIDRFLESLEVSGRVAGATAFRLGETEYLHAGELFYDDGREALYRVPPGAYFRRYGRLLWDELRADVAGLGTAPTAQAYAAAGCPSWATPVPARLLDGARFSATLREVVRQTSAGREDFLHDHHIDGALAFLRRLGQALLKG